MIASREQIEFIRAHGVTHCPPSPEWRVAWGGRQKRHGLRELSEADAWTISDEAFGASGRSADALEGATAFAEKRAPNWQGK